MNKIILSSEIQSWRFRRKFPKGTGRTEGKGNKDRETQQDSERHETSKFLLHSSHSLAALSSSFWPSFVMATQNSRSLMRILSASSVLSAGLWMGSLKRGTRPRLLDTYWAKGAAIAVCQDEETRDWLGTEIPKMNAWEGSRLRMVGLEALPTDKRVVVWFPGTAEDTERLFARIRRLNRGLETNQWRVYERKEEPRGSALCSALISSRQRRWRGWSGGPSAAQDRRSSPFWVPNQKGSNKKRNCGRNGKYHYF
jgi:hypothetical protein